MAGITPEWQTKQRSQVNHGFLGQAEAASFVHSPPVHIHIFATDAI